MATNLVGVTGVHFHIDPDDDLGPAVAFPFGINGDGEDGPLAAGTLTAADLIGPLEGQTIADLVAVIEAGNAYVNIHTKANPGGEIRGPIFAAQPLIDVGPELLGTLSLNAGGQFVFWQFGPHTADHIFANVKIAWLFNATAVSWSSFIPLLGVTNFALVNGAVLWVVSNTVQEIQVFGPGEEDPLPVEEEDPLPVEEEDPPLALDKKRLRDADWRGRAGVLQPVLPLRANRTRRRQRPHHERQPPSASLLLLRGGPRPVRGVRHLARRRLSRQPERDRRDGVRPSHPLGSGGGGPHHRRHHRERSDRRRHGLSPWPGRGRLEWGGLVQPARPSRRRH